MVCWCTLNQLDLIGKIIYFPQSFCFDIDSYYRFYVNFAL
jgi:hypothetical protein